VADYSARHSGASIAKASGGIGSGKPPVPRTLYTCKLNYRLAKPIAIKRAMMAPAPIANLTPLDKLWPLAFATCG